VTGPEAGEPTGRWGQAAVLAVCVLLALVPWFSAAAVAPSIGAAWGISPLQTALLTVAVQLGFAVGALALAVTGAVDVVAPRILVAGGALLAAAANAAFGLVADDLVTALPLRALSGAGIAAVYPVALKVLAGWFRRDRGLAVGILIGAITLGSALPHLLRAGGTVAGLDWRPVVVAGTLPCLLAALVAWIGVREGPLSVPAARFSLRMAREALRERSVQLANVGYLGHMWELYAMWTWVPAFLAASLAAMASVLGGERKAAMARELTKTFETIRRDTLAALAARFAEEPPPKGEIVVLVGPPEARAPAGEDVDALLAELLEAHSVREAATEAAAKTGLPRRELYARALALKGTDGDGPA